MFDIDITQFRFDPCQVIFAYPINGKMSAFNITVCYWSSVEAPLNISLEAEKDDDFTDFFNEILTENELSLLKKGYNNEQDVYKSFLEFKESLKKRYRLKLYKHNSDNRDEISFFSHRRKL